MNRMVFITLVVSLIVVGLVGCKNIESIPDLVYFRSEFLGIEGTVPKNWIETYPGTFKRSTNEDDFTVLVQRAYPQMDIQWLLDYTVLTDFGPLQILPPFYAILESDDLHWQLHMTDVTIGSRTMVMDLAWAESNTTSYIIVMLAEVSDYNSFHTKFFLPVVEEMKPLSEPQANTIYEENIGLFTYDNSLPLDIQETQRTIVGNVTEVQLTYSSPKGGRVPTTLLIPGGSGPFPGIIYMHGFPSDRHGVRHWGLQYAQKGVVVIMIDAPWTRPEASSRSYPLTFTETDKEEQVQLMIDLSRALDYLSQRTDVMNDQLAYVGVSYGGAMGGLFAGVDHRLAACVLVIGDGGLVTHFFGLEDVLYGMQEWNDAQAQRQWIDQMWQVEPLHYVGKAAPVPLLFQNGRSDLAVPSADALPFQNAGSQPKTVIWYNSGHNLSNQTISDQMNWLRQYITIKD